MNNNVYEQYIMISSTYVNDSNWANYLFKIMTIL